jgi:hypothetical protein
MIYSDWEELASREVIVSSKVLVREELGIKKKMRVYEENEQEADVPIGKYAKNGREL